MDLFLPAIIDSSTITFWGVLTFVGYLLTLVLIRWVLLIKKRQAGSTIAWIFVIVLIPYLGGLLFFMFGINRIERKAALKQKASRTISGYLPELSSYQIIPNEISDRQQETLIRMTSRVAGTVPTFGNAIELLVDTNRTLGLIEQAILSAEKTLHLEYYIWQPDRTGTRLRDLLISKAKEGVAVRFLYDSIGSFWLRKSFLQPMRDAGIEVAAFLPGQSWIQRWSLNLRNHRKIVIVDGKTAFTGGMNIGDEYLGKNPHLGFWRDTHLKIQGPTVLQLQQVFVEDWFYATGDRLTQPEVFPHPVDGGTISAQVVPGEPAGDIDVLHALFFSAINEAREEVTLTTSYFIPPASLVTALETASYRGVKVRLMLAGRAAFYWTVVAGRSYYDSLLKAGVEIHEYNRGLLHSKTMTIDGRWSLIGTPNFDARSLLLNFEVAVVIYDNRIADQLETEYAKDVERAKRITLEEWSARPVRQVLAENICRLFAPVL